MRERGDGGRGGHIGFGPSSKGGLKIVLVSLQEYSHGSCLSFRHSLQATAKRSGGWRKSHSDVEVHSAGHIPNPLKGGWVSGMGMGLGQAPSMLEHNCAARQLNARGRGSSPTPPRDINKVLRLDQPGACRLSAANESCCA